MMQSPDEGKLARIAQKFLPLPRHLALNRVAVLRPEELQVDDNGLLADAQVKYALSRLKMLIREIADRAGARTEYASKDPFVLSLEVAPSDPAFRNRSPQTYAIRPLGWAEQSKHRGLAIVGASPIGLSYGLSTLSSAISESEWSPGQIEVPLLEILDYPEIEERGFWYWPPDIGLDEYERLLDWLYDRKINYWDMMVVDNGLRYPSLKFPGLVRDDGFSRKDLFRRVVRMGRERGIKIVAGIVHFEQHPTIVEAMPWLKAEKGVPNLHGGTHPMCFSRNETVQFFSDIMVELAEVFGVDEIMAWLNENDVSCCCAQCERRNEFAIQAEGIVAAWRSARRKHPGLGLRILLSQGSRCAGNDEVVAAVPREVKVGYYNGNTLEQLPGEPSSYSLAPEPVVSPYVRRFVAQGYEIGLCAAHHERLLCGTGLAELTRLRCAEAADKGIAWLNGFLGDPCDVLRRKALPIAADRFALSEFGWNPRGRSLDAAMLSWCINDGWEGPADAAKALKLLDNALLALVNIASDQAARSVFDLAFSRPLLDQMTNTVLQRGLGQECEFRRIESLAAEVSVLAGGQGWEDFQSVAVMVRASSAIMRLAYPLWRWRENEGWLLSVQGTKVSQNRQRLVRTQGIIRDILRELEVANAELCSASGKLGRKSRLQPLAALWQKLLPDYGMRPETAAEWQERQLAPDERLR